MILLFSLSIKAILIATAVVAGTALLIGVMLVIAGKFFREDADEKETKVREFLPGNNCGACGYAGCDNLAKAIAEGSAPYDACPVGRSMHTKIAEVMGVEAGESVKKVAFVHCKGTCDKTAVKYHYDGIADCRKLALIPGHGEKVCGYGCMGYGTCVRECPFDAIRIVNGVAVVDKEKCTGCGKCTKACPNELIHLIPYDATTVVACNSKEKGKEVRVACSAGCIACGLCTRACESGAITVENNLARIDYEKCTGCGKCAEKCPAKIITISKH